MNVNSAYRRGVKDTIARIREAKFKIFNAKTALIDGDKILSETPPQKVLNIKDLDDLLQALLDECKKPTRS